MSKLQDLSWVVDCDYCGKILNGNYSGELKRRVVDYIDHFLAFEKVGTPSIPYISAWKDGKTGIWYEFTGKRFRELLKCKSSEVITAFNDCIIDRYIYKTTAANSAKTTKEEVINRKKLVKVRKSLREDSKNRGSTEAIYKIAPNGEVCWLKDQAQIEVFQKDRVCLSIGILVDVSNEMKAKEELKQVQEELRRHRDHLEDLVKDRTRKLWKSQLEVVSRLAQASVFRDHKTGMHITRMSRYCAVLGKAIGINRKASAILYHASPMHDVGKLGISDRILLKPGKLNRQEFDLMKTHCDIGAELLSGHNSELLKVAQTIALTHHEKWDGSGYPRGLAGKNIPLAGRITAICDVFDALTSERPYKKAWALEDALREIKKQKGSHFDPYLVDLFIKNSSAVKEIYQYQ